MKVWILPLLLVLSVCLLTAVNGAQIHNCLPPAITTQAKMTLYFPINGKVDLPCIAQGNQTLVYSWLKDGEVLDLNSEENKARISVAPGQGSISIPEATEADAGVYQCRVQNPCGVSLSIKTKLLKLFIENFPQVTEPEIKKVTLGHSLKLTCNPPNSVPKATTWWILNPSDDERNGNDNNEDEFKKFEENERITMDYNGNLYFIYVLEEDKQNENRYICTAYNTELRSLNQGEDKIIIPFGSSMNNMPANMTWHSPAEVVALEGERAKFKCIIAGYPAPTVSWRRVGHGSMDDARMSETSHKHEFSIKNVKPEDAGMYECSGRNIVKNDPVKQTFTLTVKSLPKWTKMPQDMEVGVEDNVTIFCDAEGDPQPDIQWYINGIPIENAPPASNRQVRRNALIFYNVTQSDSQVIQCNVSNVFGYRWADVFMQVLAVQPAITKEPTQQKVAKERNVTIPCQVTGKPKPSVVWYKGSQLLSGDRYKIMDNGDLHVAMVEEGDSGQYTCIAINRFGQARAEGSLLVRGKTTIVSKPVDDQVSYGDEAHFRCVAKTDPHETNNLRYYWLKNGERLNTSDPRIKIEDEDLYIAQTTSKDTGTYTCVADNQLDSDNVTAVLEVKAPPDPPYNVSVVVCSASDADLAWEFADSSTNFSPLQRFIVEYNNSNDPDNWVVSSRPSAADRQAEVPLRPWASYTFRVRAMNGIGISDPSKPTLTLCQTPEARPPRHPDGVQTVGDKTGYLVIEWEPMPKIEHNGEDFQYIITWQAEGEEEVKTYIETNPEVNRYAVKVDEVYKPYTVTVSAKNAKGEPIVKVKSVRGFSGEAEPQVVPQNFELDPDVPVTATSAGFRWDPVDTSPQAIRGEFKGYKIRYWKKDRKEDTLHEEVVVPDIRSRRATIENYNPSTFNPEDKIRGTVSNLPSYSEIEAEVVVINTYFSSNGSNIINFTTPEGVPDRVEYLEALFRGSSHFLLEWGPPIEKNGIITGYGIGYRHIGSSGNCKTCVDGLMVNDLVIVRDDLGPEQRRATIENLAANSLYRLYVWAKTAKGQGREYFIDVRTTDDITKLAFPEIKDIETGDYRANITWDLPDEKGARTGSKYYLEYRKLGSGKWEREQHGATEHFWLTLEKLEPATTYEVRVVSMLNSKAAELDSSNYQPSDRKTFTTTGIDDKAVRRDTGAKQSSFLSAWWFIGMMVAIAILILILIIVCIVKRNRGKEYKFPPEKDTTDETPGHFNEMAKSDKNGVGASSSFDRDPEKVPLEEETDSLEDYGDVDPTKFNEDGSFIGQYGSGKAEGGEPPNASAMSSIV